MAEEKGQPPAYMVPTPLQNEKRTNKKWLWCLVFYAGAVTAGLVTVSILGSMYLKRLDTDCTNKDMKDSNQSYETDNIKHYHLDKDNEGEGDIDLDLDHDREIIRYSGPQYGNTTVAVLDFKKNLAGIYAGVADTCFLIGGLDKRILNTREMDDLLSNQQHQLLGDEDQVEIDYVVDTDHPVKDLSFIPPELHKLCWGKNVYWLERTESHIDGTETRAKRGLLPRVRLCYHLSIRIRF
nr:prepropolaricin [Amphitritides sp. AT-2021]